MLRAFRSTNAVMIFGILVAVVLKIIYAALSPFSTDFVINILTGNQILTGQRFLGVYTGPGYVFAATYYLWLHLTGDSGVLYILYGGLFGGQPDWSQLFRMYAFTLFMRVPVIAADIAALLVVIFTVKSITASTTRGLSAGFLWATCPLVFLLDMATSVEIYPALLILLGAIAIRRTRVKAGAAIYSVAVLFRLAPLIFIWVYAVAYGRLRKLKSMLSFFGVISAVVAVGLVFVVATVGMRGLIAFFRGQPAYYTVLTPEVLGSIGPFISQIVPYNPDIGLYLFAYAVLAYVCTGRSAWENRVLGAEVLMLLSAYYAITSFETPFLLWMIPLLVVYSAATRFGPRRFLFVSTLGLVFYILESASRPPVPPHAGEFFFLPLMNDGFKQGAAVLHWLNSLPLLAEVFRSLFSASLFYLIFWVVRARPSGLHKIPQENKSNSDLAASAFSSTH